MTGMGEESAAAHRLAAGVWGVLATPFTADAAAVDTASLARQVRRYRAVGVTGLTALGVFGEASRLTAVERREVVKVVREAGEGMPFVVGVTALATAPAIEEAEHALDAAGSGCAGVMVQVNTRQPEELARHLSTVHAETGAPIVVQDYPSVSGVALPARELAAALTGLPGLAAVKAESSPSPPAIAVLSAELPVPIFGGLGGTCLLDELAVGAAGAMTGFSVPGGLVACVDAFAQGGFEAARAAWLDYLPLVNFEFQPGLALGLRKESLRLQGVLDHATVRTPAPELPDAFSKLVGQHLTALGIPGAPE